MNLKKRFVPQLSKIDISEIDISNDDFSKALAINNDTVKEGTVVKGQVVETNDDVIVVDVGLKNEGRIPVAEFRLSREQNLPVVGDIVNVYVEKVEGRKGTVLSYEKALREESWYQLEELFEKNENVAGVILGRVKGGFTVNINGVIAFLPGSQVDVRPVKNPAAIMGIEQPFQILKMDKKLGNIVVSRKAILEDSRAEAREEMLANIKEGVILTGIVKNITDYGAFIDLGSVDGLLHVTDISWGRINHPSEVLSCGQEIKVIVIKYNEETRRISLGMKQLERNPWENIKEEFASGIVMKGKITNITDYGAFIELKEGIEGLVHSSEIAWGKANQVPRKLLTIGQEVEFVILDIDTEKNRISLSIKKCQNNPLIKFAEHHPVGSIIKAPIRNITDFGLFVELDKNIDGMIHESDLSWAGNGIELLKTYKKEQEVQCKVLSIDLEKERVALGIKQLTEPEKGKELKKGMIVTCTVIETREDGIEVSVEEKGIEEKGYGFIRKSELSSDKFEQKPERFAAGDRLDAKIINIDKAKKITLSVKALEIEEREKAIKEYGSTDSGASLSDILGVAFGKQETDSDQ